MTVQTIIPSPLGRLYLAGDGDALTGLWLEGQTHFAATLPPDAPSAPDLPVFLQTEAWLTAYFAKRPLPSLPPLSPGGTPFQKAVWQRLLDIPCGQTVTYGALAESLQKDGVPACPRSVGGAVGRNPISILIPCHRVLGANGTLTGYAGGVERKRFLLELEEKSAG
ncbi:methylated-DNA--[protein]-cysteine S-methyltransferase [Oscillibacter sp.]|uniref:methylated-DNA--[protein]-cysteine S-methyltransferase n=1 Tax=Oscillibacter sp. TaxID=1945593 RepID=UPI00262B6070|nr:methylated-DNA--[protein]-cysteine S-methyltransferase [Oscillibacter sp.]MDD3346269.1 methylated-DNA--[protein]-cysteine S-methyltransferase [Oscillibacter sp.]